MICLFQRSNGGTSGTVASSIAGPGGIGAGSGTGGAGDAGGSIGEEVLAAALELVGVDEYVGENRGNCGNLSCNCIRVAGKGMDSEVITHLFQKFVSKSDSGTGLGLFISKSNRSSRWTNLSYKQRKWNRQYTQLQYSCSTIRHDFEEMRGRRERGM